jgi:hypothetical protein
MPLDPAIEESVRAATSSVGLSELHTKISAWLDAVTSGNESIEDKEEVFRRLDAIFESIDLGRIDKNILERHL